MKKNKNTGSTFDEFLKEEEIESEVSHRVKLRQKKKFLKIAKAVLEKHKDLLKKLKD
jgi:adenine-specific DNA methylase